MAGSTLSNTFKAIYSVLFFISFSFVFTNIHSDLFDSAQLLKLLDYLLAIFQLLITSLGSVIILATSGLLSALGSISIPFTDIVIYFNFTGSQDVDPGTVLNNILVSTFPKSNVLISDVDPTVLILDFIQVWSIAIAFVLLPAIILSFFGFIIRGEAKLAITSFVSLQILIITAMYSPNSASPTGRMMLIDLNFPTFTGTVGSFTSDFILLIGTPVFQMGLILYLLLEVAFQTSYAINVVDPMIERERRIKEHLARIDSFQPAPEKDKKQGITLTSANKKYDIVAASYLREMVERKLFKKGQQLDQKSTLRLQSFIKSTRKTDRKFVEKITAKSAQPNSSALLYNAIPSIIFRVLAVVLIAFIIVNPTPLTDLLIANPANPNSVGIIQFPQLAESLELTQPEFRVVIIFNIVLIIMFISALAHWLLVNKPEVAERHVKKVETLVDFQEIQEAEAVTEDA